MPYTVTRQLQWPEGTPVVQVSSGGIDYTNPDALIARYPGEFQTFSDPVEAAKAAIDICEKWRGDGVPEAQVAHGATGGMTMPFEPCSYEDLLGWAQALKNRLPKCDHCGDILPERFYTRPDLPELRFCREYCAEEAGS
jgi:hypothetical protein